MVPREPSTTVRVSIRAIHFTRIPSDTQIASRMMDSDDDDIYPHDEDNGQRNQSEVNMQDADDGEEEGEEVEEDDSDVKRICTFTHQVIMLRFSRTMSTSL